MSTFEFQGTGGIIEGNLGAANVNVNLDDVLNFDGTDDRIDTNLNLNTALTTGDQTYMCWFKLDAIPPSTSNSLMSGYVGGDGGRWDWFVSNGGVLRFQQHDKGDGAQYLLDKSGIVADAWFHAAVVHDTSANTTTMYVNGVQAATQASVTNDLTPNVDLAIGARIDGSLPFDGYLADVKVYDAALTVAQIQIAAAKINQDTTLIGAGTPDGWYKLTNNSTSNSGGAGGTPSVTGTTRHYDEFSVDVYDNSTTTDGTFTVTQGKVEGKALTSLAFDGTNDNVILGSDITLANDFSIATWIRADEFSSNVLIGNSNGQHKIQFSNSTTLQLNINNQGNEDITVSGLSTNTWHHFVVTRVDSTGVTNIYVDGVLVGTKTFDANNNFVINRLGIKDDSPYDGDIRDLRIYEYELSAEQAASLYSGTYPQTPNHHYKLDDSIQGTATTTAADSGTATAVNGSLDSYVTTTGNDGGGGGSGWQNGTLDLDGNLTIAANGTLSAPRGTINYAGTALESTGTFTHNNGTVLFDNGADVAQVLQDSASGTLAFYNLTHNRAGSAYHMYIKGDITVENILLNQTGMVNLYGPNTLTLGTTSSAATCTWTSSGLRFHSNTSGNASKIHGVSSLYPALQQSNDWDWDSYTDGYIEIKNLNFDPDVVTNTGNLNIKLTGDCEFDAFTVSGGDTLDLNAQRMECSGNFTASSGTCNVDFGAGMLIAPRINIDSGTYTGEAGASFIVTGSSGGENMSFNDSTFTGDSTTNILINNGTTSCDWNNSGHYAGNIIVGTGTYRSINGTNNKCGNLTVATGGTLDGSDDTLTLSGDFTTSGGLIGESAITLDGTDQHYSTVAAVAVGTNSAWTIEGWMKRDSGVSGNEVFVELKTASNNNNRVWFNIDTDDVQMLIYSNSGSSGQVRTNGLSLNDGKWHHVACTYDSTTVKIYVDGKLENQGDISKPMDNTDDRVINVGANVGTYANGFTGSIDEVRIWDDVRTEAEIRANMFSEVSSGDGLVQNWRFNEGTGDSANANVGNSLSARDGDNSASSQGASLWAGAGTFTFGTSTLTMAKSGSQKIFTSAGEVIYALTVNAGSTTDIECVGSDSGSPFMPTHNVTINGTLSSTSVPLYMTNDFVSNGGAFSFGGSADLTGLNSIRCTHTSGTIEIPAVTTKFIRAEGNGGTTKATGNLTLTTELQVDAGATFNANTNTINVKNTDVNGGTLDLRNSTLNFYTGASDTWTMSSTSTLTTGNTTVTGDSTKTPTNIPESAGGGFEIVGDVSNLDVTGDLTVIGSVTNCTGNIRQFHHTLDTQQLLDADEAGDDDLRLTKPALDNALELMTK